MIIFFFIYKKCKKQRSRIENEPIKQNRNNLRIKKTSKKYSKFKKNTNENNEE